MRFLAVLLVLLIPTVTTAQTTAQAAVPLTEQGPLDVLPLVADSEFPWQALVGFGLILGLILFLGVAGEDLGVGFGEGVCLATVVGAVAYYGYFICGGSAAPEGPAGEADEYAVAPLLAYGDGALTEAHRREFADVAHERGREGVVLQRLVETRAGVGSAIGEVALEIVVLDAETAQLRPLTDDPLAPQTVLSIPVDSPDELAGVQAEAFEHLGVDT